MNPGLTTGAFTIAALLFSTAPLAFTVRSPWIPLVSSSLAIGSVVGAGRSSRKAIEEHENQQHRRQALQQREQQQTERSLFPERIPALVSSGGIERLLLLSLKNWGIEADFLGKSSAPAFHRVRFRLRGSATFGQIERRNLDLQTALGLSMPPMIGIDAVTDSIAVDVARDDRQFVKLTDVMKLERRPVGSPVCAIVGVDLNGSLKELDLSDPNSCHILVAGTTGSGKTEFLKVLLVSLIGRYAPESVRVVICDPKRVTFPQYKDLPWLYAPIAKEEDLALLFLCALENEMRQRYERMEAIGCDEFQQLNQQLLQQGLQQLPRIVVVFDEYADFMLDRKVKAKFEAVIKPLAGMARAAGINLILATQRPSADVVTPLIRSNLPCRIALKTSTIQDSAIVLGGEDNSAAYLLGKGDLFLQAGGEKQRLQALYFDQSLAEFLGEMPIAPTHSLALEESKIKPVSPSTHSKGVEHGIDEYKAYRSRGLSPDTYLREVVGVKGGNPYSKAKAALHETIDLHLEEWLNELDCTDEEAIQFIWNIKPGKRSGEEFNRRLEQIKSLRL
jgi:DNA segregation ATPase FtsK/SpoIIIE-like protein